MLGALGSGLKPTFLERASEVLAAPIAMTPLDTPSSPAAALEVRPADQFDREQVSSLILLESHVHKHLDWKTPLDWLGRTPFMVLQEGGRLSAALACPPDPPSIAWLRLFVFASHLNGLGDLAAAVARRAAAIGSPGRWNCGCHSHSPLAGTDPARERI